MGCNQACPYNTLNGCKVKKYNAICPLTNMASVTDHKPMTNADRIRAMSDKELAETIHAFSLGWKDNWCDYHCENQGADGCDKCILKWLQQPAEEVE